MYSYPSPRLAAMLAALLLAGATGAAAAAVKGRDADHVSHFILLGFSGMVSCLVLDQPTLGGDAVSAGIIADRLGRADHAMAGHDDRKGIASAGLSNGARTRMGDACHLSVTSRITIGNIANGGSKLRAAGGSGTCERQIEVFQPAREPRLELMSDFGEQRCNRKFLYRSSGGFADAY